MTGVAALLAIPLSLILGISAALYRNSYYDRSATGVSLVTISSPEFFTAYIFILLLATLFPVFPTISNVDEDSDDDSVDNGDSDNDPEPQKDD